ncbi:MAG TPA: multifunctional ribose 5-phosphate isomerase B/3-demethylubiquinone-9 3-methyltransferase/2-octaprenyl-6-hydroxy phenol methylase [Wolbachia sp.]|jgi:2-polyprenyl-6-hydroxyphenyl methylase/3-demethylubiquinone-9 3-methyltransferase|uniref:bifunctional 2-polyprenyl-6-hydroxyphenol methylase/3-demethylubiquinol 3-O-methyltransferase UbiG n=1 Tax=Wolbachia endosymbiont of Pentalonia nigronervosa TaxID=1301914 RepID=UPI000ED4B3A5|nr:bifunctional 2-polyprenyl-6-hydroxyphenol methylase/3-demethylubiquinol 3-O-methyltransferase UbiG [Wolbachia endosymbiont of Pentalonia nigronervosa]MBD0391490.1 bifunctional 2-polyprenyl-6-hydroxyphenol methylase/3-demethylubiquinol 3-O-methyltransferase UbiG [Wolbachia endosymbiont of Pentalonia nigronervosa]HCE59666.1 multifunctional ribose 5-phosphate isomerase B/3-demethylubiquinone-9 3-methyltransferase/2-octaprenyl-6-hydroxy phenol methylase [Wolbachia sp.]
MSIISIASDHAGFKLKSEIILYLEALGYVVTDHGCTAKQKCVDYLDYAVKVAEDIVNKKANCGVLICGTGSGMSIVANRFEGIRAVLCNSIEIAKLAREHNDANVLCLGARFIASELAKDVVKQFLETGFSNENKHKKRLDKLSNISGVKKVKTYNKDEISKFAKMADDWWNENGKFKPLHMINPIRVSYIVEKIKELKKCDLKEISLLDIGCGGGILSESMARIGVNVTGIDACEENIKVAQSHAKKVGLNVEYMHTSVEELDSGQKYDAILLMEVVEHVDNLEFFLKKTVELLKPGGLVFVSTINRTIMSFFFAIVGAEYILNWLPKGTHSWKKFVKPSEIANSLRENNVALQDMAGIEYSITKNEWQLSKNVDVNYILYGKLE